MNLTKFAFKQSAMVVFALLAIVVYGLYAYFNCPSQEDPNILIREAVIYTACPGLDPQQVNLLVTEKIERKARELPEIDEIYGTSLSGASIVHVWLKEKYFNLRPIWQELRSKIHDVIPDLPTEAYPPQVNDSYGLVATAVLSITSDQNNLAGIEKIADEVRDGIYAVPNTEKIVIEGVQKEKIYLETNNNKLANFNISPFILIDALKRQNAVSSTGILQNNKHNIVFSATGNFNNINDVKNAVFNIPGANKLLHFSDIFTIKRGYVSPASNIVYSNQKPAVALAIYMSPGANILKYGKALYAKVASIQKNLPADYRLSFSISQPERVAHSLKGFQRNLYETVAVVLLVIILFLGLRTGLIVGTMVPLSILIAVIYMYHAGIELHRVSIAAMIISLGLLVDNGIIVAENIMFRVSEGMDRKHAALESGKHLAIPLLTSTLTTIIAFVPLLMSQNIVGEYTRALAQVIAVTLLGSWLLSICAVPLFCYWFQHATANKKNYFITHIAKAFHNNLGSAVKNSKKFMLLVVILLLSSWFVMGMVPKKFFPASERNQFLINLDLPAGYSINQTDNTVKKLTKWLGNKKVNPQIKSSISFVGFGGIRFFLTLSPFDPEPHKAFIVVNTKDSKDALPMIKKTENYLRNNFVNVRPRLKEMWLGTTEPGLLRIRVVGHDYISLINVADIIKNKLKHISGTTGIYDDWDNPVYKLSLVIDQVKAERAGLTYREIANTLYAFYKGIKISEYREHNKKIDIVVRAEKSEREDLSKLPSLTVYSDRTGKDVPLSQVAKFKPTFEYSKVKTFNLQNAITIYGTNKTIGTQRVIEQLTKSLAIPAKTDNYEILFTGEQKKSADAENELFKYVPIAIILIIILLILQFNSLMDTVIILSTIPMAFIGSFFALWVTQVDFGFMAVLGLMSLAGIIINNGIILVDSIKEELTHAEQKFEAVLYASSTRVRPIVMATITTILGLIPLLMFGGPLWRSMCIVIIFGLAIGSLVTLYVVPVLYCWVHRIAFSNR
ncbi:MAG: efflux RND transporter permease subunit [Gammaproteobacteria bacterium]|nr:efflux RND transporter permease subunit [Gammaproteobacteria bacterium]